MRGACLGAVTPAPALAWHSCCCTRILLQLLPQLGVQAAGILPIMLLEFLVRGTPKLLCLLPRNFVAAITNFEDTWVNYYPPFIRAVGDPALGKLL